MAFTVTPRVRRIAEAEWKLFEQVHNIGGRASCQDSPDTFFIMRSSQLMAWSEGAIGTISSQRHNKGAIF